MVDRSEWVPLSDHLQGAIDEFNNWSRQALHEIQTADRVENPLYHYTDAAGLDGIIKNQQVWFTDYRHLNDPSEMIYGMEVGRALLNEYGEQDRGAFKLFCDMTNELFSYHNMHAAFSIFIASLSKAPDDLGQWRAYGDDGKGFSLGLSPALFEPNDQPNQQPNEKWFVSPVVYGANAGRQKYAPPINRARQIVENAVLNVPELRDPRVGMPFFDELAKNLIAAHLIFNSLSIKHEAYEHEQEVRLVMIGQPQDLRPYVSTRPRSGDIVPYIKVNLPIQEPDNITDLLVGPAAAEQAEHGVRHLLHPFTQNPASIVRRSGIPYRGR